MKKFTVFIVFIIFALFAFLGYRAAAKAKLENANSSQPANSATALASIQQNYVLIHVDDLAQKKPQLIAVWGVFVYYAQPNQIMFLPLLPSYDAGINDPLYNSFSLQKNGLVSASFIDQIQQKFNFQVTGFVMVDSASLAVFTNLLTGQQSTITATTPENDDQKHVLLINAQSFFQGVCSRLQNPPANWSSTIPWSQFIPAHFSTNLAFETIMVDMEKLTVSGISNQCSVLSSE